MANEIIPYIEMCQREGTSLQRGMNFEIGTSHSVILMSVRKNAPYSDRYEDDNTTIIYEGHDVPRTKDTPNPKDLDQLGVTGSGRLTQNGLFEKAALDYKRGLRLPELVRVYEKIQSGIWSYNGLFHLVDTMRESVDRRTVFKFKLVAHQEPFDDVQASDNRPQRRIIPTAIKLKVWRRDAGKCIKCGATDDLHFDHIIPYSKGGSSNTSENVQLLCRRHNIQKSNRIE